MRAHLLVCRGPDCASRGAQDVYTALAWEVERQGLSDEVVQTQCGCVGPLCGAGPVVCCYPTGAWYAPVGAGDAARLVEADLGRGEVRDDLARARLEGAA
jgi:(2Fe-2S) ferredoxin